MTVDELIKATGYEIINVSDGSRIVEGAYTGDLLSWVMGNAKPGNVWVTIMTNQNVLAVATLIDMSCVIVAEGSDISDEVAALAKEKEVNLLHTRESSFSVCRTLSELIR